MHKINGFGKISDDSFLDSSLLNRREFLKRAALASAWFLAGTTGIGSLAGCGDQVEWEAASFPKVLFHNFGLFDGIKNQLQQDLVLLIKGDKIQGIERQRRSFSLQKL